MCGARCEECIQLMCGDAVNGRVFARSNIHVLRMNSLQYKFYFWNMLYGMSHGFDIIHELLVMDWHFKDILCLVVLLFYRSNTFPI